MAHEVGEVRPLRNEAVGLMMKPADGDPRHGVALAFHARRLETECAPLSSRALCPGSSPSASAGAGGSMDPGDKHRDDTTSYLSYLSRTHGLCGWVALWPSVRVSPESMRAASVISPRSQNTAARRTPAASAASISAGVSGP